MQVPARSIRASVEDLAPRRFLTERQIETRAHILAAGQRAMAEHGRPNIRMATFAEAIQVSPGTIRQYFCDLDNLLAEILRNHILAIFRAIGEIPIDAPDSAKRRRAAYHAATHTCTGAYTEAQYLLLRDRLGLPPDLSHTVENLRLRLGEALFPAYPATVLALLDAQDMDLAQAERALAALEPAPENTQATHPQAAAPRPEPAAPEAPARRAQGVPAMADLPDAAIPGLCIPGPDTHDPDTHDPDPPEPDTPEPERGEPPLYRWRKPSQDYGPAYNAMLEKMAREAATNPAFVPSPSLGFSTA